MVIVVAVDDRYGMTFNHRRLSQDRELRSHILAVVIEKNRHLWMNAYTRNLFANLSPAEEEILITDEDFLAKAPEGDFCYVENVNVRPYENRIEEVLLCQWNRRYPADTYWELNMSEWSLLCSEEMAGSSHKTLTINHYRP